MTSLRDVIDKYNFNIQSYKELNNIKIIESDNNKYVLKKKNIDDNDLYNYLNTKKLNILLNKEVLDEYNIYPYINELNVPKEDKAIELVNILSLLHNKTTYYRSINNNQIKEQYETLNEKIDYLKNYYLQLQDVIEQKIYMSPAEYLLIRNVSLVYSALDYSKEMLKKWYDIKKNDQEERVVLLHGKPCLNHILFGNEKKLISWDNYKRDIPIYDFIYFYKKDYLDLEMYSLFSLYQSRFYYNENEYLLFLTLISIPDKIVLNSTNFENTRKVYRFIRYIEKTRDFILKQDKKEQEEYEEKLNE